MSPFFTVFFLGERPLVSICKRACLNFTCLLFVTKTSKLVAMRGDRETGRPGFKCKQFVGGNEI